MPTSTTRTVVSKRLASFTPLLLALFVFAVQPVRAPAQTTAFTFQGQLTEAGTGANGDYDVQCALFDIAAGGTQIGTTQTVPAVVVASGLFTVQLDFGVNAFPGADRFLQIGVRPVGGGSYGFQNLSAWFKETDNNYFRHKNGYNYGSAVIVPGHEADRVYDTAPLKLPSSLTMWWAHP